MGLLDATTARPTQTQAPQAVTLELETLLVKQLLDASGAFKGSGAAGSTLTTGLFADTLAEAIAKSGQLGLSSTLEHELQARVAPAPTLPAQAQIPSLGSPLADASAHVTSAFGQRVDPLDGTLRNHHGVDIAAHAGSPILAAGSGVVVSAGTRGGYGQAVEIKHDSGLTTLYAHAQKLLVKPGDHVVEGQTIATVGQTGRATGPHLHFEVRSAGHPLNPTRALSAYGRRAEGTDDSTHE